jgi:tripartite-type tricarboxylate transporter receptor subunit TctC
MFSRRHFMTVASTAIGVLPFGRAFAQGFPSKPIRIIVPFAAGGTGDILCRSLQEPLQRILGQPIIIENRTGAGGAIGTQYVKNVAPDGYTLVHINNSTVTIALMQKHAGYDPVKDFTPVANIGTAPLVFLLNPAIKANNVAELIAYAKSRPGELEYASTGRGSMGHLTTELFNQMAGLKMLYVPYQGNAQSTNAMLAGDVKVLITSSSDTINSLVETGKIRMIGITSPERSPLLPNVPAVAETLPKFNVTMWFALAAPAATPPQIVARLNDAVNKALSEPSMQEKLKLLGMTPAPGTAAALGGTMRNDQLIWANVIQQGNLNVE